jgi:propionyl-CoA carboxylase beta chain
MKTLTKRINDVKDKARLGGGLKRLEKQHEKGRLTARERIEVLLDEGSFREYDMFVEHRYVSTAIANKVQMPRFRNG